MFAQLKASVEGSGNSWPEFVETYQTELFCILMGVNPTDLFDQSMLDDYPGLTLTSVASSASQDSTSVTNIEPQVLEFNRVGTYVWAYYRKHTEVKEGGGLVAGRDLMYALPNNRRWQTNKLTGTWRAMGNYNPRRRRGLYLKVLD